MPTRLIGGAYYFAPYATEGYAVSVVVGASIGVGQMWVKPVMAVLAGVVADKIGVCTSVFGFLVIMTHCFLVFSLLPGGNGLLFVMLINVAIVSVAIFAIRGIYFALLDEGGIHL